MNLAEYMAGKIESGTVWVSCCDTTQQELLTWEHQLTSCLNCFRSQKINCHNILLPIAPFGGKLLRLLAGRGAVRQLLVRLSLTSVTCCRCHADRLQAIWVRARSGL